MCPPAVPSDIESNFIAENIIMCLYNITQGDLQDLPSNLMRDFDFFRHDPEYLPPGMWFLIQSEVDGVNEDGKWSIKGEAYKIVLDSKTTCSINTFEFYKGQGPHERRTNWVMHEYRILQTGQFEGSNKKETKSLCRVFRDGEESQNHEKQLKLGSTNTAIENHIHTTQSVVPNVDNSIGQSSTSQPQVVVDDNRVMPASMERSPDHQHQVEDHPEDDFIEMLDLENPLSPSSSSESSCVTISSDDWFDSGALMQEIESDNNQRNAGCKLNVSAPVKPDEVVVLPATSGSLNREKMLTPSEILKTGSSTPESAVHRQGSKIPKPNFRNEGSSSNSHNLTAPFSSHIVAADQENTAAVVRKKKFKKYLCFMPF